MKKYYLEVNTMNEIKELEKKVSELEGRIKFLYGVMEKQTKINDKLIEHIKELTDLSKSCSENTIANSKSIYLLSTMI